jgi:Zn ribbon nucleic-acid-binding protein
MRTKRSYSNEEIARIQKEFTVSRLRNRHEVFIGLAIFGLFCISAITVIYFAPNDFKNLLSWLFIILFAILFFVGNKFYPGLKCPACQVLLLDSGFGDYCPVCSGNELRIHNSRRALCPSCNRKLEYRAISTMNIVSKNFKIRACTHCGVPLSRSGI